MRESAIEKKVCLYAHAMGWTPIKMNGLGKRGMPDRMFIRDGKVFFIEFKTAKGKISTAQKMRIEKIKEQQFNVYIVRSVNDGMAIINGKGRPC